MVIQKNHLMHVYFRCCRAFSACEIATVRDACPDNDIGDDGGRAFATALRANRNLTSLCLLRMKSALEKGSSLA